MTKILKQKLSSPPSWPARRCFGAGPAAGRGSVIIGAAIAQSGVVAPYDDGPAKAMEVAIEEINAKGGLLGQQIKIIYADTKSDIAYGATAAQDVIDKGAQMVVVTCDYDYRQRRRLGRRRRRT